VFKKWGTDPNVSSELTPGLRAYALVFVTLLKLLSHETHQSDRVVHASQRVAHDAQEMESQFHVLSLSESVDRCRDPAGMCVSAVQHATCAYLSFQHGAHHRYAGAKGTDQVLFAPFSVRSHYAESPAQTQTKWKR
jgi:hypothetical protein